MSKDNPWLLFTLRDLKNEAKVEVNCIYVNRYDSNYIVNIGPMDLDRWQLAITVTGEYEKVLYFDYLLKQLLTKCENLNKCLGIEKATEIIPIDKDGLDYYALRKHYKITFKD